MTNPDLDLAVRQRVMHRTSQVEALMYQYGWTPDVAEARYDADTAALAETGVLPDLPPSPDVSGTDEVHVEPTVEQIYAGAQPEQETAPDPAASEPEPVPGPLSVVLSEPEPEQEA